MNRLFRSLAAVAVTTAATASLVGGLAGVAHAAGNPPWTLSEPASVGSLIFYNSAGQQITGGSTTSGPLAAYVEGTSAIHAGDTKATLEGFLPVNGEQPTAWSGEALGLSTTFPVTAAGTPTSISSLTVPVNTGHSTDTTVAGLESDFPNTDTSTDGYAGVYELRLATSSSSSGLTTSYDSAYIQITGSTWSVAYPTPSPIGTTTTLTSTPASSSTAGGSVQLNASVTPAAATGTVEFYAGTTDLGAGTLSGGVYSLSTTAIPTGSGQTLKAVFTPTAPSGFLLGYAGSSGTETFTVNPPPAANTLTALSVAPTTSVADTAVAVTAAVTNSATSAPLTTGEGAVSFYDDGTDTTGDTPSADLLQTVPLAANGTAVLNYGSFAVGAHNLVAVFVPANSALFVTSVSSAGGVGPVLYTATAPLWAPDAQGLSVSIPNTGSLVISSPYSSAHPFSLGTAQLDANDLAYHASAAFGSPTDADNGSDGVTITDTRAGDLGWTASAEENNFTGPGGATINGQNLEFTGLQTSPIAGNALTSADVDLTPVTSAADAPNANAYGPGNLGTGTDGLAGEPHAFASAGAAPSQSDGSIYVDGVLTLAAPTSTPAGTYTATLTFTIA